MFSFNSDDNNTPIMIIKGGKDNGKIIYIDYNISNKTSSEEVSNKSNICQYCNVKFSRMDNLKRHINNDCCKFKLFKDLLNDYVKTDNFKEFKIKDDGIINVLPNYKKRECIYISGPMGSGKSYFISQYLKYADAILPKKAKYLFSRINEDKSFSDIKKLKRIKLDDDLLDNPIEPKKELKNSIVIFDDIENSSNKEMTKYLETLRDDILKNGRDQTEKGNDIYCLITSHQVTNWKSTRDCLNEATCIVIYPKSGSTYGIKRGLKEYCGLDKQEIDRILKLNSRWVAIYKTYPMFCVYEKGCYFFQQ